MISTYIQGGIGNNLFQIAACLGHAAKLGNDWKLNYCIPEDWAYAYYFKGDLNLETSHLQRLKETRFEYQVLPRVDDVELFGYWQSWRYFDHIKEDIKELFKPNQEIEDYINDKYGDLISKNTCAIHVRRQDYLQLSEYHYNLNLDYYYTAMSKFDEFVSPFVVFSDDIEWCKRNFIANYFIEEDKDIIEFFLMCRMKNFIIANSSFSWWASYLSGSQNIIAPKNWFGIKKKHLNTKDLYLPIMKVI